MLFYRPRYYQSIGAFLLSFKQLKITVNYIFNIVANKDTIQFVFLYLYNTPVCLWCETTFFMQHYILNFKRSKEPGTAYWCKSIDPPMHCIELFRSDRAFFLTIFLRNNNGPIQTRQSTCHHPAVTGQPWQQQAVFFPMHRRFL